ncbi:thioesterase family protein [Paenibacillus sp. GP183]|jgi:acyl-CoA thioester hydrolase|uniref:acyl-CoA thioesterase n=1 Tax=Paenibacillus sp. GP183 TaxID=1882751 RepID=UPI00089B2270|nr:thioesterase family protein [Paenibacillus sp. GP183]SEB81066.1 acyl-CoA thioester hydrolase [Paenibacillus sp. GP183]
MRRASLIQPNAEEWLGNFHFSIPLKVRYSETDMLGHLNNVSYFIYFEQGRVDYFEHLGLSDYLFNEEAITVVADLECQYLAQVYLKEPLKLYIRTASLGRTSLDLEYALVEETNGQLKAVGRGAIVRVDTKSGKSSRLPEAARDIIRSFEGKSLAE